MKPSDHLFTQKETIVFTLFIIGYALLTRDFGSAILYGGFLIVVTLFFKQYIKLSESKFVEMLPLIILVAIVTAIIIYNLKRFNIL